MAAPMNGPTQKIHCTDEQNAWMVCQFIAGQSMIAKRCTMTQ
jgi:hypothetical protein